MWLWHTQPLSPWACAKKGQYMSIADPKAARWATPLGHAPAPLSYVTVYCMLIHTTQVHFQEKHLQNIHHLPALCVVWNVRCAAVARQIYSKTEVSPRMSQTTVGMLHAPLAPLQVCSSLFHPPLWPGTLNWSPPIQRVYLLLLPLKHLFFSIYYTSRNNAEA